MIRFIRGAVVAISLVVAASTVLPAASLLPAQSAAAWTGSKTAAYADAHWNDCKVAGAQPRGSANNPSGTIPTFTSDGYLCFGNPAGIGNCAAYASEALQYGGYSYVNFGYYGDQWYYNGGNATSSFRNAPDLYNFLTIYDHDNHNGTGNGGGSLKRTDNGYGPGNVYDTLAAGDLLFFDFGQGTIDHVRVEIGWYSQGFSPPHPGFYSPWNSWGYYGDYADNQSPGRYHDFWNGYWANQNGGVDPQKVTIYEVSIDTRNN